MKKLLSLLVLSLLLFSCGGGGDSPPPILENNIPSIPSLVYPTNNLLCIDNTVEFKWNASTDPDGGTISYQIQVAKDNLFTQISFDRKGTQLTQTIVLEKGVAYYFRVRATDSSNGSSEYSAVNQFYTEGDGVSNHLPFAPTIVQPALNALVQTSSITLEWAATDVDNDSLTYDVYVDTVNPPVVKLGNDISVKTLLLDVTASTNYYWYVVVKDGKGGVTIGQVWNFKTD
jgi:hypothetical protein